MHFTSRALRSLVTMALLLVGSGLCMGKAAAQSGTIEGGVTSAETGRPVPRANVLARGAEGRAGTSTDSTGAFRLQVTPGTDRVRGSALGFRPRTQKVDVQPGASTQLSLALVPEAYSLNEIVVEDQSGAGRSSSATVQRVEPRAIEQQDAADVSDLTALVPATHVDFSGMGQVRYTGGTYARNQQNDFVSLPAAPIVDARVDNLTDEAKFIRLGLPGPGRADRVGVKLVL